MLPTDVARSRPSRGSRGRRWTRRIRRRPPRRRAARRPGRGRRPACPATSTRTVTSLYSRLPELPSHRLVPSEDDTYRTFCSIAYVVPPTGLLVVVVPSGRSARAVPRASSSWRVRRLAPDSRRTFWPATLVVRTRSPALAVRRVASRVIATMTSAMAKPWSPLSWRANRTSALLLCPSGRSSTSVLLPRSSADHRPCVADLDPHTRPGASGRPAAHPPRAGRRPGTGRPAGDLLTPPRAAAPTRPRHPEPQPFGYGASAQSPRGYGGHPPPAGGGAGSRDDQGAGTRPGARGRRGRVPGHARVRLAAPSRRRWHQPGRSCCSGSSSGRPATRSSSRPTASATAELVGRPEVRRRSSRSGRRCGCSSGSTRPGGGSAGARWRCSAWSPSSSSACSPCPPPGRSCTITAPEDWPPAQLPGPAGRRSPGRCSGRTRSTRGYCCSAALGLFVQRVGRVGGPYRRQANVVIVAVAAAAGRATCSTTSTCFGLGRVDPAPFLFLAVHDRPGVGDLPAAAARPRARRPRGPGGADGRGRGRARRPGAGGRRQSGRAARSSATRAATDRPLRSRTSCPDVARPGGAHAGCTTRARST